MKILVTGAGGFIGGHLIKRLRKDYPHADIIATDIKHHTQWYQIESSTTNYDTYGVDLRDYNQTNYIFKKYGPFDQVWALACDHGGIGYLKAREYECALDVKINMNLLRGHIESGSDLFMFASSACVYNDEYQEDPDSVIYLEENTHVHPASPDSVYGWVKLVTEKAILAAIAERGLNARIARIHGCYGPYNSFNDIKEKAPNALLRKALTAKELEVWGSLDTVRSFMYVDDCIEGLVRLSQSRYDKPINIGSDMTVTIGEVAAAALQVAGNDLEVRVVDGERGVAARSCDCTLMESALGFKPSTDINHGLAKTLDWLESKIEEYNDKYSS